VDDDLLIALRTYRPRDGLDPLENFVSEAFAWVLRNHPALAGRLLARVEARQGRSAAGAGPWTWSTQVTLRNGKRPDLVCEGGGAVYGFEHKVWADLGRNQLADYRSGLGEMHPDRRIVIVLITPDSADADHGADVAFCWRDVHGWITEWMQGEDRSRLGVVASFLRLLEHEGLGPFAPISVAAIRAHFPAAEQPLSASLGRLVGAVFDRHRTDFGLGDGADQGAVVYAGGANDWGTYGLQVVGRKDPSSWTPGLHLGFLLAPQGYGQTPSLGPGSSPDFCLILDFAPALRGRYPAMAGFRRISDDFAALARDLGGGAQGAGWNLFRGGDAGLIAPNPNHPLCLRQPMLEFFRDTATFADQVRRFAERAGSLARRVSGLPSFRELQGECGARAG
jgi:hypothetical protein